MSKKTFYIILIFLIASFEIYVFNKILHPNVNDHYQLYYIDKKLNTWSHGEGIQYTKGTILDDTKVQRFLSRKGWLRIKKSPYLFFRDGASIYFKTGPVKQYNGILTLKIISDEFHIIKVKINNKYIENKIMPPRNTDIKFIFDKTILNRDKVNSIEFKLTNYNTNLAIAFKSLKIE